jgi:GNAT superfamily N-acetyltransferase
MNPTDMTGSYVAHRRGELLTHAEEHRRASHGRDREQSNTAVATWVRRMRQLALVQIRPIADEDKALIRDGFAALSAQSRRSRFLYAKSVLSDKELHYLTHVDHLNHEALVAVRRTDGVGLGVARYVRDADNPTSAELAVTIADDWQSIGLGTRLMTRLIDRAHCAGIRTFTALMHADNIGGRRLLGHAGAVRFVAREDDQLSYEVDLVQAVSKRAIRRCPGPAVLATGCA